MKVTWIFYQFKLDAVLQYNMFDICP